MKKESYEDQCLLRTIEFDYYLVLGHTPLPLSDDFYRS